jgi:hypothetical protein
MAFRFTRSPSATTEASDTHTKFMDTCNRLWPGATVQPPAPRIARLTAQHDEWLKRKQTDGRSWYDIITESMDETSHAETVDQYVWDADADSA